MANSKLVFVDFHDSFSHNILAYLKDWGDLKVIHPEEINKSLKSDVDRFIWGPGPGRADEYGIDFNLLKASLKNPSHRHFGICLGHQLLGLCLGGVYTKEDFPKHGVSETITLPEWQDWGLNGEQIEVQSYNSLTVELESNDNTRVWKQHNRVVMLATHNALSFQFHPESVGTSCPERLFSVVQRNFI